MPIFIELRTNKTIQEIQDILEKIKIANIDKKIFDLPDMIEKKAKYNYFIPKELLKKQYIEDCIDVEEMQKNL